MESKLRESLRLKFEPVAIYWTNNLAAGAKQFAKGKWGCVMMMYAQAAKGKTVAFDRETFGCMGGAVGLGFGNVYERWPGGIDCFYRFLSTGNENTAEGKAMLEKLGGNISKEGLGNFLYGERYCKTPEIAKKFVESLPMVDVPEKYVVMRPLKDVDLNQEPPKVISLLADCDQLSALIVLANYAREKTDNVTVRFGAACHQVGILPLHEAASEHPRAVLGMTDLSARENIKNQIGHDHLAFSVPLKMFLEMEGNVEGSFLERPTWKELSGDK